MGGEKQVAKMVLKVDLQCHRCYKKIKKVLCNFPQVQDQVYDEEANTVTIKVVCCSPEKIKNKIKCKGGDTIKAINIEPPKPRPPVPVRPTPPEKPKETEKPKAPPPKPKDPPKEAEKPKDLPPKPKETPAPAPAPAPAPVPVQAPAPAPEPVPCVPGYPPAALHPYRTSCPDCYDGRPGGPCFYGCVPAGPPPCYQYDGYYGRPVYDSYGGGRSYYVNRYDYFSEENTGACAIM